MKKSGSSKRQSDQTDYQAALGRAAALCSRQEQCSSHIRDKLGGWNVNETDAEKIIRNLQEEKFLDDRRYAGFYVKDKFRFNKWGKIKISHMLRQKKISEEIIGAALEQIDEEDWFQTCLELIQSKSATLKEKNLFTRKGKLYRYAAGRGFEPDLIHRALNLTIISQ
ncbi:MAG: regulatory protein RecX [Bacteroidota bacterium]